MEIQLNDYHKKVNAMKMASMAYWREHPLSLEECLAQFKRLREQRLARESKLQGKGVLFFKKSINPNKYKHVIFHYTNRTI